MSNKSTFAVRVRPRHPIWIIFDSNKFALGNQETLKFKCLQCNSAITVKVDYLETHVMTCTKRSKSMIDLMDVV